REIIGRDGVAVRRPQLVPAGDAMRPVHESPLAVEGRDVLVRRPQAVDETLEGRAVVEELVARLVVDLITDDSRVLGVAADDLARDPVRVPAERGVRVVAVLAVPVRDSGARLAF